MITEHLCTYAMRNIRDHETATGQIPRRGISDAHGVRPSIWDLAANTATEVKGTLVDAGKRNQSASVLLPPAQAQRVMLIGGEPSDMHDQTGATNTTAITDLSDAEPAVATAASLAMRRMHLCATLLPDRTVLVNGGSMMEESGADAVFEAEIYHPDTGGGPGAGRWPRHRGWRGLTIRWRCSCRTAR
jgi:hypothetical protein